MNDKAVELLRDIADKLEMEFARVWPQIVLVTWVQSICYLIINTFLVVGCSIAIVKIITATMAHVRRQEKAYTEAQAKKTVYSTDFDSMGHVFAAGCAVVVLGLIWFFALSVWPTQLSGVLFPEAQTVINLAKR